MTFAFHAHGGLTLPGIIGLVVVAMLTVVIAISVINWQAPKSRRRRCERYQRQAAERAATVRSPT